jgi:hypothetical protein
MLHKNIGPGALHSIYSGILEPILAFFKTHIEWLCSL